MSFEELFPLVSEEDLPNLPFGTIVSVGGKSKNPRMEDSDEPCLWISLGGGKAQVVNNRFPDSETEDLDWFANWDVRILGINEQMVAQILKS